MTYTATTITMHTESFRTAKELFAALDKPNNLLCKGNGAEVDRLGVWLFNTKDYQKYKASNDFTDKVGIPILKDLLAHRDRNTPINIIDKHHPTQSPLTQR